MKVKLMVSDKCYSDIEKIFISNGFEIDEDADFVLYEKDLFATYLIVKNNINNERERVTTEEIICIESLGHDVLVFTAQDEFKISDRLYQLERILNPDQFLRISNSVIISRNKVKKIKPALSSKFILTMSNDKIVDVTRSYYNLFKESFGL